MSRIVWLVGILVVSLAAGTGLYAEEHGGQEHGGAASAPADTGAPAESGEAPAPSAPAPAAPETPAPSSPAPAAPALKPIVITFTGSLSSLDQASAPAMLTVEDRYGVKKEIACPGDCKVTQGASAKTLADLKTGDKLTVEYTYDVATGKRTAQAISVGESAPPATP
ncbi:MAG: hypothetical protein HYS41_00070 [Candidatus Omnitrophica bacterium]|nr:hypothetical protein [Candidatus Omnitrophota bacterium]